MWAHIFIFSFLNWPLWAGIVSLDLCADQWLLGLAKKEEIHSISYLAKDPELSYLASQATSVPTHSGTAESLLNPAIKTMIGYEPISPVVKKLCQKKGIHLIALSYPHSFQELKKQILFLSQFFHQPRRGNKWIQQLNHLCYAHSLGKAAFYGAHGLSPGNNTLLSEVLTAAGYENLYRDKEGWTYNSLESLLSAPVAAVFFSDPPIPHPLWNLLEKKNITLKKIPYRLTLCPYPPAIFDLIHFLKEASHA